MGLFKKTQYYRGHKVKYNSFGVPYILMAHKRVVLLAWEVNQEGPKRGQYGRDDNGKYIWGAPQVLVEEYIILMTYYDGRRTVHFEFAKSGFDLGTIDTVYMMPVEGMVWRHKKDRDVLREKMPVMTKEEREWQEFLQARNEEAKRIDKAWENFSNKIKEKAERIEKDFNDAQELRAKVFNEFMDKVTSKAVALHEPNPDAEREAQGLKVKGVSSYNLVSSPETGSIYGLTAEDADKLAGYIQYFLASVERSRTWDKYHQSTKDLEHKLLSHEKLAQLVVKKRNI